MAQVLINNNTLSNMADEIRTQKGIQDTMTPDEMVTEIQNIGENATAEAGDIANGKTAITSTGLTTGTNTNNTSMELVLTNSYSGVASSGTIRSLIKTIPEIDISSCSNLSYIFQDCWRLEEIPSSIDTSNCTGFSNAFSNCFSLRHIPNINTNNGISFSYMFNNCHSLESIPSTLNTDSATANSDFRCMFNYCMTIKSIPSINTSNAKNLYNFCGSCSNLETVPTLDCSSAQDMGSMFSSCNKLTSVSLTNTGSATNMNMMFYRCTSLVNAPQLDTSSCTNMRNMFDKCTNLTTVPVYNLSSISSSSNHNKIFSDCPNLSNESLNNILATCITATSLTTNKKLSYIGLSSTQATTCQSLSNYQAFLNAGWVTGY